MIRDSSENGVSLFAGFSLHCWSMYSHKALVWPLHDMKTHLCFHLLFHFEQANSFCLNGKKWLGLLHFYSIIEICWSITSVVEERPRRRLQSLKSHQKDPKACEVKDKWTCVFSASFWCDIMADDYHLDAAIGFRWTRIPAPVAEAAFSSFHSAICDSP